MSEFQTLQSKGQYLWGSWVKNQGKILQSFNPAVKNELLWSGTQANEEMVLKACETGHQALTSWSRLSFDERASYVKKFADLVEQRRKNLAYLISLETGKPLWESQTEVTSVIQKVALSIQAYQERCWPKAMETDGAKACLRFKPQGLVLVLGAFNFPAHLSNGHIVPALLAGNTVLYKPSEQTPAVAEFIINCWHESGIPKGTLSCLQGDASLGALLLTQDLQGVYFTGSYATGMQIHQAFNKRPEVILALEMGGNNPLVIDEIDNLQAALYYTVLSTLISSGQRCTCARRLIIPDSLQGDEFLKAFIQVCTSIQVAPFQEKPEPFMGPVIHAKQALKHLQTQQELKELGGKSLLEMRLLVEQTGLLSPGIMDMSQVKTPPDQEIFAPFVQIYRYHHFDEAIQLANQTQYGLSAALFSKYKKRFELFYQELRAGLINWNKPTTGAPSHLPFGGVGLSGNHRPTAYYATDYCAYPVTSMQQDSLVMPQQRLPGFTIGRIK